MRYKGLVLALGIVAVIRLAVWLWPESPLPTQPGSAQPPEPGFIPQELHPALRTHLEASEIFTLLSLDPDDRDSDRQSLVNSSIKIRLPPRRTERFHDFGVLGKTELRDAQVRTQLVAAICDGIRGNTGLVANCFDPRHGVRALRGTQSVDLVICFECLSLRTYGLMQTGYFTEGHAHPIFDRELTKARVPQVKPH